MADNLAQPSATPWKRVFLQALVLVMIGTGIGVADAFIRPVKLSRTISDFPTSSPTSSQSDQIRKMPFEPEKATPQQAPPDIQSHNGEHANSNTAAAGTDQGFVFTKKEDLPAGQITIDEAKSAFDSASAVFVDARKADKYAEGHIPGAVRLELADFQTGVPDAQLAQLPKGVMVIVYCGGGHCDESERVAERLEAFGYAPIFIIHDGFPGWKAAGHPFETGE